MPSGCLEPSFNRNAEIQLAHGMHMSKAYRYHRYLLVYLVMLAIVTGNCAKGKALGYTLGSMYTVLQLWISTRDVEEASICARGSNNALFRHMSALGPSTGFACALRAWSSNDTNVCLQSGRARH